MTVMKIVVVKDRATEAFGQPFFVKHVNEALRSFADEVNRDGSSLAAHPDDYDLYVVGEFDDQAGTVGVSDGPVIVARGKDLVRSSN